MKINFNKYKDDRKLNELVMEIFFLCCYNNWRLQFSECVLTKNRLLTVLYWNSTSVLPFALQSSIGASFVFFSFKAMCTVYQVPASSSEPFSIAAISITRY